jgi:hypothetical protein
MQPKALTLVAIAYLVFLGGCDDPVSPRDRSAAEQAQAARTSGSPALTTSAPSGNQIDLWWRDNSPNEAGWEVHRSTTGSAGVFTLLATLAANATFYANTGLTQNTEYCYKVRSFKNAGPNTNYSAFLNTSCSKTLALPETPSNVSVSPVPELFQVVAVTWSDNSATETGFRLERSANMAGPFELVATVSANVIYYENYGQALEQQVCYRVVAFNGNGASDPSNVDCTAPPKRPTGLAAQSFDGHSIDLTWSDNSAVEDGYDVQRAESNLVFVTVATAPANATSYHDASVTPDVRYWYRVRALKDGGSTPFTNYAVAVAVGSPPTAPTDPVAVPNGSTAITLYWSNPSDNTEKNRVERSLDGGSSWATVAPSDLYPYGFVDTGRTSEQQVCYRVFAVNTAGESPPSGTDCTTPPAAATNFSATFNDDGSEDLRWKDNSGVEDAYVVLAIYWEWDGTAYVYEVASLPPNTESYRIDYAEWYYGYYFTAVAVKDGGYSDWAAEAILGASQTGALRASTTKDPRIASRSGQLTKPFDVRISSLKKLRR